MPTHDMGGWVFYTPKPNKIVVQEDEDWGSILNDLTGVITGWRSRIWLALLLSWAQRFKLSSG
jgi:hypothetical protein